MKRKKLTVLLAAFSVCALVLAGCNKTIDKNYVFEDYAVPEKYVSSNRSNDYKNLNVEAPDDDTVIFDGIVNAEEYGGKKIDFSDANGVKLTMYSKMSLNGVFFGFSSDDGNIYCNPDAKIYNNTSVEIQLAVGGTQTLNANVLQLRYSADGASEGWIGLPSGTSYEYMRTYVETACKATVYGELNSSDCSGYDIEAYVPYSALNLSEKPESLICAPSFNTRASYDATGRTTWTIMVGSSFTEPTSWYKITDEGQTVITDGFEKSAVSLRQTGAGNQFYYLDDEFTSYYYLSASVKTDDVLNGDEYPKFGLVNKSENTLVAYYLDVAGGSLNNAGKVIAETTEFKGTDWLWDSYSGHTFNVSEDANQSVANVDISDTVRLELLRCGDTFWFFVNGMPVIGDTSVSGMQSGSVAGLFFFNMSASIMIEDFSTDETTVRGKAGGLVPATAIDGNLDDWDREKTLLASETDATNGNSMSVYAKTDADGIYIAYDAVHSVNTRIYSWDDVWYNNVNAEFWIGHQHFALTRTSDSGYMLGKMVTEERLDGTYRTVAEIFVPYAALADSSEDVLNLGVAFKTCDSGDVTDGMKFRGDSWWYFTDRFPTAWEQRFGLI